MSQVVNNRKREHVGVEENTFLGLPNEILTKIFEKSSAQDRENLASINPRLHGLEKKAGYRRFAYISFQSNDQVIYIHAITSEGIRITVKEDEAASFFNNASTDELVIQEPMDITVEKKLMIVFKTIQFQKLVTRIDSGNSSRIIRQLLKGCKIIKGVDIAFMKNEEIEDVKHLFQAMSPMDKCIIRMAYAIEPFIDNNILMHLIRNQVRFTDLSGVFRTKVTTEGLAKAFEMICMSPVTKEVRFNMYENGIIEWCEGLDSSKFEEWKGINSVMKWITHIDSRANLKVRRFGGAISITMYILKKEFLDPRAW